MSPGSAGQRSIPIGGWRGCIQTRRRRGGRFLCPSTAKLSLFCRSRSASIGKSCSRSRASPKSGEHGCVVQGPGPRGHRELSLARPAAHLGQLARSGRYSLECLAGSGTLGELLDGAALFASRRRSSGTLGRTTCESRHKSVSAPDGPTACVGSWSMQAVDFSSAFCWALSDSNTRRTDEEPGEACSTLYKLTTCEAFRIASQAHPGTIPAQRRCLRHRPAMAFRLLGRT